MGPGVRGRGFQRVCVSPQMLFVTAPDTLRTGLLPILDTPRKTVSPVWGPPPGPPCRLDRKELRKTLNPQTQHPVLDALHMLHLVFRE